MHSWDVSPKAAIEVQNKLRREVSLKPLSKEIKTIAGADVSLNLYSTTIHAGIVVFSYPELKVIASASYKGETKFPYIPGLLSFREIPALLECVKKLAKKKVVPDLIMVDGQGIAHPRHLGIASHLGIVTDIPTIGCAKSLLYGKFKKPKSAGDASVIVDPKTGEELGYALQSKARCNPLIISPGHKVSLSDALTMTKECLRGYRLPEPTRLTHEYVNRVRKGEVS